MFRNILYTFISRLTITLLSFVVVVINARCLGAAGVGTIGLITLAIAIIQLMHNLAGGSIVYLVPREKASGLLILGYSWALITSVLGSYLLSVFLAFPLIYRTQVIVISCMVSLQSINLSLLLGKKKFKLFNILSILQVIILLIFTSIFYIWLMERTVLHYLYAFFFSYFGSWCLSLLYVASDFKGFSINSLKKLIKTIFAFGKWVQLSNIFQLFNYRVSYYLVEYFSGRVSLGIFTVGSQVSESLWLVGKSVAIVQYSSISNSKSSDYAIKLTLLLIKLTFSLTALLMILLLLIPGTIYSYIFGHEFSFLPYILLSMSIGILSISVTLMLSHYFAGTGKPIHNAIASGIGMVINLLSGIFLIPWMGLTGAGITLSLGYSANMIYLLVVYMKNTKTGIGDFVIRRQDFNFLKQELINLIPKKEKG